MCVTLYKQVSAIAMLESLVHFCDYLLNQADPGEVVAASEHVKSRVETLLAETAQDDFTDRIIALLCQPKLPPEPPIPQNTNPRGGGSLTSDDRSSFTDDTSIIESEPGGLVTDLEDNAEEGNEEEQSVAYGNTELPQAESETSLPKKSILSDMQDDNFKYSGKGDTFAGSIVKGK